MPPSPRCRHLLGLLSAGLCGLTLLQACGARSDTEDYLFGDSGTGPSSSTGARPGGSGADGSGADGSGANGSGANGSDANGSGADGTGATGPIGGTGSGGTSTGGTGQGASGGVGQAGEPSGPAVSCGDTSCNSATQVCCAGLGGFGCIAKASECSGAVLSCSNGADCAGNNVCCLRVVGEVGESSECKPSCLGMGPGRERQLCSSNDECPFGFCRATVFGVSVCTRR